MIKAVLFDMDGLMINTEPLQSRAYEIILRKYDKEPIFYPTGVIQKVGVREKDNWGLIKASHGLDMDISILIEQRGKIYASILRKNLSPQPGLIDLINSLHDNKIIMAVASSSTPDQIAIVLEGLDIRQRFSAVVSGQSVERGKPYPDIFLETARQLDIDPQNYQNCIVLEDAQTGVEAGKAAGMKVIAVPNEFTADQDVSKADLVLSSLKDVNWERLRFLVEGRRRSSERLQ